MTRLCTLAFLAVSSTTVGATAVPVVFGDGGEGPFSSVVVEAAGGLQVRSALQLRQRVGRNGPRSGVRVTDTVVAQFGGRALGRFERPSARRGGVPVVDVAARPGRSAVRGALFAAAPVGRGAPRGVDPSPVPLPAGLPLLLAGLVAFGFIGRRRQRG